ncbi:NAD(P)-binding domain-containing protein [Synechococcus sp. CS-1331]|uniref:NAD(P)-binding domain-containing protein n=1 Tax=Synechococcus sp. CS-1331 TaxID=2847973 RepID=UPI0028805732|nr:NAD(P)-binding domain-containing protein [Synechococcus sp. CS-1331]
MEITLVGSGLLGTAIGERLLARGYRLHVWNRRQERAQAAGGSGGPTRLQPCRGCGCGRARDHRAQ